MLTNNLGLKTDKFRHVPMDNKTNAQKITASGNT